MVGNDEEILAELKKIRELLTPAPAASPKGFMQEFRAFIQEYKVLGLAVAFILGLYLGALVKALVSDLILPILSFALPPGTDINRYMISVFGVGDFLNNLLTFIIVALVIFAVVKGAKRWHLD